MTRWSVRKESGKWRVYDGPAWSDTFPTFIEAYRWAWASAGSGPPLGVTGYSRSPKRDVGGRWARRCGMTTETLSVSELEEVFALEIPCGGNNTPEKRPCPGSAPAVLVKAHASCGMEAPDFKCIDCHALWAAQDFPTASCKHCGLQMVRRAWYRKL